VNYEMKRCFKIIFRRNKRNWPTWPFHSDFRSDCLDRVTAGAASSKRRSTKAEIRNVHHPTTSLPGASQGDDCHYLNFPSLTHQYVTAPTPGNASVAAATPGSTAPATTEGFSTESAMKEAKKMSKEDIFLLCIAWSMPPCAVFGKKGLKPQFWISICLTVFLWLPGMIYAYFVVRIPYLQRPLSRTNSISRPFGVPCHL